MEVLFSLVYLPDVFASGFYILFDNLYLKFS